MSSSPRLVSLGSFTEVDGEPALGCPHMAAWLPWYILLVELRTGVDLRKRLIQAAGDGAKSALTHLDGTALDWRTRGLSMDTINEIVRLAREAGARGTWYRTGPKWVNNQHVHSVVDCPCTSRADYQLRAADRGRDGLAGNGPDNHPAPRTIRNHASGLAWLITQLEEPTMPMPSSAQIAQAIMDSPFTANGKTRPLKDHLAELFVLNKAQSGAAAQEAARDSATLKEINKRFDAIDAALRKGTK